MEWLLKSKNDWMQGIGNINMSQNEKLRNSFELRSFILVAGVGFEPTTFRLWA